jgi:hypothetical protein
MDWYVAHMRMLKNVYRILVGRSESRDCMEDLGIYGRISLNWIVWIGLVCRRISIITAMLVCV